MEETTETTAHSGEDPLLHLKIPLRCSTGNCPHHSVHSTEFAGTRGIITTTFLKFLWIITVVASFPVCLTGPYFGGTWYRRGEINIRFDPALVVP